MTFENRPNAPIIPQAPIPFRERRTVLATAWACHFAASVAVILWGSFQYDDDRKYIPIDTNTIEEQCFKAYANVLASSIDENGAIICCTNEITDGICKSLPWYLIFARRLTKLPEAWLLPLFPLLVRIVVKFVDRRQQNNAKYEKRRFYLYFGLIQIRGWVLYLFFNKVEDLLVQPAGDECWYDEYLRSYQASCQGKVTDYSDHIVLFLGQILPIAFIEVLFSFLAPYWKNDNFVVPTILSTGLLYLYYIVFLAIYKTTAYYHTLFEIGIGYLISLLIQVSLFLIVSTSFMKPIRDYFFGHGT